MRLWFRTILLLTMAVVFAIFIKTNESIVIFELSTKTIELRLSFFVMLLLLAIFIAFVVLRLLEWTITMPMRVRLWKQQRSLQSQQAKLENAWLSLIDGRNEVAQHDFRLVAHRSKGNAQRQIVALLSGIRVAHAQNSADKVAAMLAEARNLCMHHPKFLPYVAIVEAEVLLDQAQADQAYDVLHTYYPDQGKFPHIARLRLRIARQQLDAAVVLDASRHIAKRGLLPLESLKEYIVFAFVHLLQGASSAQDVQKVWKMTKTDEKLIPEIALAAAAAYTRFELHKEAQDILEQVIEKQEMPTAELVGAYARAPENLVKARIAKAESWLKRWPKNAAVLQALGILCIQANIWGAAQKYLEQSLQLADKVDTRILLANLFDGLGKEDLAQQYWRAATQQVLKLPQIKVGVPLVAPKYDAYSLDEPDRSVGF